MATSTYGTARRRWQQAAAVAAGAAGAFFAYRRWMAYRQELEDEEAAAGYYVSSAPGAGSEARVNSAAGLASMLHASAPSNVRSSPTRRRPLVLPFWRRRAAVTQFVQARTMCTGATRTRRRGRSPPPSPGALTRSPAEYRMPSPGSRLDTACRARAHRAHVPLACTLLVVGLPASGRAQQPSGLVI